MKINLDDILNQFGTTIIEYGPKLLSAAFTAIIGWYLLKLISKSIERLMDKKEMDPSLKPFLKGIINTCLTWCSCIHIHHFKSSYNSGSIECY